MKAASRSATEAVGGGAFGIIVRSHWTVCAQSPKPGRSARSVVLTVARTCLTPGLIVPDVVGEPLDDAEHELAEAGLSYTAESVGGEPILVESFWTVCSQDPGPGERGSRVELYASHDCCDDWECW